MRRVDSSANGEIAALGEVLLDVVVSVVRDKNMSSGMDVNRKSIFGPNKLPPGFIARIMIVIRFDSDLQFLPPPLRYSLIDFMASGG